MNHNTSNNPKTLGYKALPPALVKADSIPFSIQAFRKLFLDRISNLDFLLSTEVTTADKNLRYFAFPVRMSLANEFEDPVQYLQQMRLLSVFAKELVRVYCWKTVSFTRIDAESFSVLLAHGDTIPEQPSEDDFIEIVESGGPVELPAVAPVAQPEAAAPLTRSGQVERYAELLLHFTTPDKKGALFKIRTKTYGMVDPVEEEFWIWYSNDMIGPITPISIGGSEPDNIVVVKFEEADITYTTVGDPDLSFHNNTARLKWTDSADYIPLTIEDWKSGIPTAPAVLISDFLKRRNK